MVQKQPFKKPKITTRELNMRVAFYSYKSDNSPLPTEREERLLKECWAHVEGVWDRDKERAKETGAINDVTIKIRDFREEFVPDLKHRVKILDDFYADRNYEVVSVKPNEFDRRFVTIIAKLVS